MFFFFNDTATTEIYTLSLHDALSDLRSLTGDDARARRAWRLIARQVDTIVVNAEALRREGEAHGMAARWALIPSGVDVRSEEHTSELQSQSNLVCRLLLEKKNASCGS